MSGLWRKFRALAGWVQAAIAVVAALVALSPFTSDAEEQAAPAATTTTAAVAVRVEVPLITTTTGLPAGVPAQGDDSSVVRVIDGDTIEVAGGTRVRLIGVDTPEAGVCFAAEATGYANELVPPGTRVRLVYDVQRLDQYGRTLAYVYKLSDGVFVNLALARNGFALQDTFPPNVAHAGEFGTAAAGARAANLGLWNACVAPASTTTTRSAPVTAPPTTRAPAAPVATTPLPLAAIPTTTAPAGGGCHPSYSGACVPTGFSDVDCAGGSGNGPGYVSAKRFLVVGPDVYGLDGNDNDGIACES